MLHRFRVPAFALLLVLPLAPPGSIGSAPAHAQEQALAPARSLDAAGLDAYIRGAMRDWEIPGLAIAVIRDDSVIFARGYGERTLGTGEPVDEHTLFAIASTTKAMTVAALGLLVDEGTLDWDDRVSEHLPGFELSDPY
ncbi:MAG TPA: serine hydrolase domain-containing protein, partial [Longimicrobiales bacterium]|nr:serine hydrolase domain-containing protein [Longimicrobiales bacterium]